MSGSVQRSSSWCNISCKSIEYGQVQTMSAWVASLSIGCWSSWLSRDLAVAPMHRIMHMRNNKRFLMTIQFANQQKQIKSTSAGARRRHTWIVMVNASSRLSFHQIQKWSFAVTILTKFSRLLIPRMLMTLSPCTTRLIKIPLMTSSQYVARRSWLRRLRSSLTRQLVNHRLDPLRHLQALAHGAAAHRHVRTTTAKVIIMAVVLRILVAAVLHQPHQLHRHNHQHHPGMVQCTS